jgi:hypothetical protein
LRGAKRRSNLPLLKKKEIASSAGHCPASSQRHQG